MPKIQKVVPKSLMGIAINYALGQWDKLLVYIDHADMSPGNNHAENAIRTVVLGRKNWLFSGTPEGAQANALEPYKYLRYFFEKLPSATTMEEYLELLPMNLRSDDLVLGFGATGV